MPKPKVKDLEPDAADVKGGTKGGEPPCIPQPPIIKLPPVWPMVR
jgi:hypothetical protein